MPESNEDEMVDVDVDRTRTGRGGVFEAPGPRKEPTPRAPDPGDEVSLDVRLNLGPVEGSTRAGRYTLLGLLGKGGMAEVFLATQDGPQGFAKTCVVKRIRRSLCAEPRFVDMFLREARVAAQLNHPNAVQIFELGQDDSSGHREYFLAMEFLDGISLHRAARRCWTNGESFPMEVAIRAVADAALGLHHAHTLRGNNGRVASLVHRDVSPDNIMLTRDGVSKVLDFGIAKSNDVDEMTGTGEVKGKIPFMSPEQLQGTVLDGRSDLWSLGVTMYWLLTGRRPFDASSEPMTIDGIMRRDPQPPRTHNPLIPFGVEQIVMNLLNKDPNLRVGSGALLADQLLSILGPAGGYSAAATFAAKAMQWPDSEGKPTVSALMIFAARPESQWLRRLDEGSAGLERLFPAVTPTGQRRIVPEPLTAKTVTGLHEQPTGRHLKVPPVAAGGVAAAVLTFAALAFLADSGEKLPALAVEPAVAIVIPPPVAPIPVENPLDKPEIPAKVIAEPVERKPTADTRLSVRTVGPTKVSWRAGKKTLGKGAQSFKVPKGTTRLTAVDGETGGVSEVAVVDGVADYQSLGTGTVLVRVQPWANIELGNKKLGETPVDRLTLPAGRYTFKLTREALTKTASVDVKAGGNAIVNVDLRD